MCKHICLCVCVSVRAKSYTIVLQRQRVGVCVPTTYTQYLIIQAYVGKGHVFSQSAELTSYIVVVAAVTGVHYYYYYRHNSQKNTPHTHISDTRDVEPVRSFFF